MFCLGDGRLFAQRRHKNHRKGSLDLQLDRSEGVRFPCRKADHPDIGKSNAQARG